MGRYKAEEGVCVKIGAPLPKHSEVPVLQFYIFGEASPTKIDYRKQVPLF